MVVVLVELAVVVAGAVDETLPATVVDDSGTGRAAPAVAPEAELSATADSSGTAGAAGQSRACEGRREQDSPWKTLLTLPLRSVSVGSFGLACQLPSTTYCVRSCIRDQCRVVLRQDQLTEACPHLVEDLGAVGQADLAGEGAVGLLGEGRERTAAREHARVSRGSSRNGTRRCGARRVEADAPLPLERSSVVGTARSVQTLKQPLVAPRNKGKRDKHRQTSPSPASRQGKRVSAPVVRGERLGAQTHDDGVAVPLPAGPGRAHGERGECGAEVSDDDDGRASRSAGASERRTR